MRLSSTSQLCSAAGRSRGRCPALASVILAAVLSGNAWADGYLEPIGGRGGGQFQARCPAGELLTGFELRTGDDIDAVRPLCVTPHAPSRVSAVPFTVGSGLIRHYKSASAEVLGVPYSEILGDWSELEPGWHGGAGGDITHIVCPKDRPVVIGMFVGAEGVDTIIVNNIHLFCGLAALPQVASDLPAAIFDAPAYRPSRAVLGIGGGGSQPYRDGNTQHCPADLLAVGVHGRSGVWLDAMGLICGQPPQMAIGSIGRLGTGSTPPAPPMTICERARNARARNSPAAPSLEAQCLALGRTTVKSIGRVRTDTTLPPRLPRHICDSAKDARARNSPSAPNLEAQCRAAGGPPAAPAPDEPPVEPAIDDGA